MIPENCPHCDATPLNREKATGLEGRCEKCNGLISYPVQNSTPLKPKDKQPAGNNKTNRKQ